jgi:tetratricopeptide (TPR) repeat protein
MKKIIILTLAAVFLISHILSAQLTKQAVKLIQRQQYAASIVLLEKSVRQNPALTDAAYWLSVSYIQNNEPEKALSFLEQSSQRSKPLLQAALANVYAVLDNDAKATALLASVNMDLRSLANEQLAAAIGRSFSAMDDFVKAENYYQRAVAINPSNPENYLLLSYNAARHRDASIEESYLDKALLLDSNFAPAWYHKAAICLAKKDMKMYIAYLHKTVAADSFFAPAWKELYEYAYTHKAADLEENYRHYLESCDKNGEQEYELLARIFNEDKYAMVINKVSALMQQEKNRVIPDLYRLAACSYYQLKKTSEAYHEMLRYLQMQDVKRISSYDKYLTAAFASQLSSMDTTAVRNIETAFADDSLLAERKYFASVLINHFIKIKDRHAVAVWKEKLLPYKDWDEEAMYLSGMNWYELDELQHADSLFASLVQKHPAADKAIFMRAVIHSVSDSAMTKGTAVPFYESFLEKAATTRSKELQLLIEKSYEYLGRYYLAKKEYGKALYHYNKLAAYQPSKKSLRKTINRLNRYMNANG